MIRTTLLACAALVLAVPAVAAPAPAAPAGPAAVSGPPQSPAGLYKLELSYSSLIWLNPQHGIANYMGRFTRYDGTIDFNPANIAASSITLTIDPRSVRADYPLDYKATHPTSRFASWDDDLANSDRYMNATRFPQITFKSTRIEPTGARTAKVTGDLTFLGVTRPMTMDVTMTGEVASHPTRRIPALGFRAEGLVDRAAFGMPGNPGQTRVIFDGQFHREAAAAAPAR